MYPFTKKKTGEDKKMKKIVFILAIVLLTACQFGNKKTTTTTESDADKVAADKAALTISGDLNHVTDDLVLPTSGENGTTITWESSNTDIITDDGIVTPSTEGDATVILTATITLNDASDTKEFTVIVTESTGPMCPGIEDPSQYEIANPGFETGDLCGWTATGDAFSDDYVLDLEEFWAGNYNKDGSYLFTSNDHESETGTLTSIPFELGGTGWISFKLGAAKHTNELYMVIKNTNGTEDMSDDTEVVRYGNTEFDDNLYTANLVQYKADLSEYIGEELYIQIVDEATSDWAWISMDSFYTYYENESNLPQDAVLAEDISPSDIVCDVTAPSAYEIINGGFDTGNICGWTATGEAFTHFDITDSLSFFDYTYTPEGGYLYSSYASNNESKTGTLTSSTFELGGIGYITFKLGGAKPKSNLEEANYISIYKEDGTEIAQFMNDEFNDDVTLYAYKADLSGFIGENLYIVITDNATSDWGTMFIDSINTYYTDNGNLPQDAIEADNKIAPDTTKPVISGTHDFSLQVGATEPNWLDGITATDDEDGDVTVVVDDSDVNLSVVGTYTVTYTATDSSGNVESVNVTVTVTSDDVTAPDITLTENEIYVQLNATEPIWTDYATANDNTDGDITGNITVDTGQFDISVADTYTISYTVTDSALNETTETLTVHVVEYLPTIENDGFETGDFTGWTPDGDAFTLLGMSDEGGYNSEGTYHFNTWTQQGNGGQGEGAIGSLTSSIFRLSGSGYITFKIGAAKSTELIYIQVLLEDGTEIARYGNDLFDNNADMYLYKADLSTFLGQNMYIKVVDNATSDWAFANLDSFVTYYHTEADLPQDANLATNQCPSPTIENGDFETGDLTGWTTDGTAFADNGITNDGENNSDSNYFKPWNVGGEDLTGTLTSSTFKLLGSGYITFQIGAAKHPDEIYISVYNAADDSEIARYGNYLFNDSGNLISYKADLSDYIGENLYIKVVDQATADWALIVLDNFVTYYETETTLPQDANLILNMLVDTSAAATQYDIANPSFETGDLTGWTATGDFVDSYVQNTNTNWWGAVGKDDYCYLISGDPDTGTLTSSTFTLNDTGIITFRMGGAQNQDEVYISIYKEDGTEIARYGNSEFDNNGYLNLYKADLSSYIGENLYIQLVDNDIADFAWLTADDFETNYASANDVPDDATLAINILNN